MATKKKKAAAPAPEPLEEELEAEEEEEVPAEPETEEPEADEPEIDEDPPEDPEPEAEGPTYTKQLTKTATRIMGLLEKQFGEDEVAMQRVVRSVGALVGLKLVAVDLAEIVRPADSAP